MARFLYRLGHGVAAHAVLTVIVWVVLAVGLTLLVGRVGAETSNDLSLPGTDSQQATDLLEARFPPQQNGSNPIVFHVDSGVLDTGSRKAAIATAAEHLAALPYVASAPSPFSQQGAAQL